jgi:hypothetical protein
LLASLLLEDPDSDAARIRELLSMAAHAGGGVSPSLARLQARQLRREGREREADAADEVASRLEAEGRGSSGQGGPEPDIRTGGAAL